jgi:tetratricopeptide (TPR) repeat protein
MPLARASAVRALELEPSNAQAHDVLCFVAATYEFDWKEAEKQSRLVADAPGPLSIVSIRHLPLGRFDEAVREADAALVQDPLNATTRVVLLMSLYSAGLYDRAIEEGRKAIGIVSEHYWNLHYCHGMAYAYQGKFAEAREPLERAFQLAPWQALVRGALAGVLACLGEKDRAEQLAAGIPETAPAGWVVYHRLCSNIETAADWYEKNIEQRHPSAAMWARAATFKPLRESPRWPKLARMMNLPE